MTGHLSYLAAQEHVHDLRRAQEQRRVVALVRAAGRKLEVDSSVRASARPRVLRRRLRLA